MKLSIIIPTYKKPLSIIRCLESANRYCKDAEIIVVIDDESKLEEARKINDNFRFVVLGNGTGAPMAMWKGIFVSSGDAVGFIGDDVEFIEEDTDKRIVATICDAPIDAIVGINDGIGSGRAHPFMRKKYWLSGGGFPPCYNHYFGDTELQKIAVYHKKWLFKKDIKIVHHHNYHKNQGFKNINILEDPTMANRIKSKGDGDMFKKRMSWWEQNGKPRFVPYNIGWEL